MREWKNYGDVSFLTEGGTMVRPAWDDEVLKQHPLLSGDYQCLMFSPFSDEEGKVLAALKNIDVNDYREEGVMKEMESYFGVIPEQEDLFAAYCAEYRGVEPGLDGAYRGGWYPASDDYVLTMEEAKKWLEELEVPQEYIK